VALLERNATPIARTRDLPRAAVEIIARLSAERNRLREEVSRLRTEVRQAPSLGDVARLRAERDALARQLAASQGRLATRGQDQHALATLVARVEQAAARLERAAARPAQSARAPRPVAPTPGRTTRPMARGGGMLAGLVRENTQLRQPGASQSATRTRATPPAALAPRQPEAPTAPAAPKKPRRRPGGGFLNGLIDQNLGLRHRA
jgi:septal ring factor EnvC (AmiA/AmiB activator)